MSKSLIYWLVAALVALVLGLTLAPETASYTAPPPVIQPNKPSLSHAQDTWVRALEWCESSGKPEAINPNDLDNTPSYGAFQFKPSTFEYFSKLYGITGELMDRDVQYEIVSQMVLHRDEIAWDKQFPWCVKKLGFPPRK
jgi:hypothetical protein